VTKWSHIIEGVEEVFRALGDPHRRLLLDRLFERDGQSLGELCAWQNDLTRFGVMKHLRVLEGAGLVTSRKAGREKLHYLNPVPIRLIHDRWISKYAVPWVEALGGLKMGLEGKAVAGPKHVYEVYIRTTPEQLWQAITDPDFTRRYFYGTAVESSWQPGATVVHRAEDGSPVLEGKVLDVAPPQRLVTTFIGAHDPEQAKDRPSRVTWVIQPLGEVCKLTLTHDDFDGETATYRDVGSGWNPILSGLKTLLETGKPLAIPM
jgi:uncharacterized protein YndB with AHSA1/START domain/DNA-binding transcriptional ArsR family regulator